MGRGKISLSKKVKDSVKRAVKYINDFEKTVADIAIFNGYDYVLCGHIHHPEAKTITNNKGSVEYLNSGDWIENLTGLEYSSGKWSVFKYQEDENMIEDTDDDDKIVMMSDTEIFSKLFDEFTFSYNMVNAK
jgi:DNA repair exonuclease SbcCD nuclease subunit